MTSKKPKLVNADDLGLEIGTKKQVFWRDALKKLQDEIFSSELTLEINIEMEGIVKRKIEEEKEKLK